MNNLFKTVFNSTHTHGRHLKFLFFMFLLLFNGFGNGVWGQSFCGTYQGVPPTTNNPDSLAYDRFGNAFHIDKLAIPPAVAGAFAGADCSSGYFNLTFYGTPPPSAPADPNHAVCSVFSYLSDNITRQQGTTNCGTTPLQNVNLQVAWLNFDNPDTVILKELGIAPGAIIGAGIGTPFLTSVGGFSCKEVALDRPFIKINGGVPPGGSAAFDGRILLNTNINWNYNESASNFPNQLDLYSVVLHEGLHVLGFASRMGQADAYSLWDQTLRVVDAYTSGGGGANPKRAIMTETSSGNQLSCTKNCWQENTTLPDDINSLVVQPCGMPAADVVVVGDAAIAAVGGYDDGSSIDNILSHLNENCNSPSNLVDYVMSPGIALNQPQRIVSDPEWNILCALGYTTTSCAGCYSVAHSDEFVDPNANCCYKKFYGCLGSSIEVLNSDLLCNDITNGGNLEVINVYAGGLGTLTITPNATGDGWIISQSDPSGGSARLFYSISGCDCRMHNQSFSVFFERECPDCIYDGDMCENLLCYNDFENYTSTESFEVGLTHPFILEGNVAVGTPDLSVINGNHYLFMGGGSSFNFGIEPVTMELNKCISPRCSLLFEASLQRGGQGFLEIWGSNVAPCDISENAGAFVSGNCSTPTICNTATTFSPHCIKNLAIPTNIINPFNGVFGSNDLQEFTWINNTDDDICFLTLIPRVGDVFLDNIEAKIRCTPKVTCNYQGNPEICHNGTSTMTWLVCAEDTPGSTNTTVTVNITLPTGVNAVNPAQLTQTVSIAKGACVTISVDVTTTLPVGTMFMASMKVTSNLACEVFECEEQITVVEECTPLTCQCTAANTINIDATTSNPNYDPLLGGVRYSQLEAIHNYDQNNDGIIGIDDHHGCISISGTLLIDAPIYIENCSSIQMNDGAEIVVLRTTPTSQGGKLWLINNSLFGCAKMWKGVTAQERTLLFATRNRFYDAEYALQYMGRNNLKIQGNEFVNNYVGIEAFLSGASTPIFNYGITNNRFIGYSTLKPLYPGQDPTGNWAYMGIHLSNVTGMDIGENNLFLGVSNALEAGSSPFTIKRCTIQDLIPNTLMNPKITGINAISCPLAKVENCVFTGVGDGIVAVNTNLEVSRNTIVTNAVPSANIFNAGIYYSDGNNRQIRIKNNAITTCHEGIAIHNCPAPTFLEVTTDSIYIHSGVLNSDDNNGISFYDCNNGGIFNNRLYNPYLSETFNAIRLNNSEWNLVEGNRTEQYNTGIQIQGGGNNSVVTNEFVGLNGQFQTSTGAFTKNSANNYCENTASGHTNAGFHFDGTCLGTNFSCNDMQSAYNGLFLSTSARISPQLNRGNTWTGPFDYKGAVHASSNPTLISLSRFTTDQMVDWIAGGGQSISWFLPLGAGEKPLNCATVQCPTFEEKMGKPRGDEDGIAKGEITEEGLRWIAQSRLLEHLAAAEDINSTFPGDVVNFYNNAYNTDLGKSAAMTSQMNILHQRSASENNALQLATDAIAVALQDLSNTRTLYANTPPELWASVLNEKTDHLETQTTGFSNAASGIANARMTEASILLTQNNAWIPEFIPADNEQVLNEVYLNQALWNTHSIAVTDLEKIKNIADQCPSEGGSAVYRARNMYKRLVPTASWDINMVCTGERNNQQTAMLTTHDVSVFPNPANNTIHFAMTRPIEYDVNLVIYDTHGALLHTQVISANTRLTTVTVNILPSGVYFYRFISEKSQPVQGKFIIRH